MMLNHHMSSSIKFYKFVEYTERVLIFSKFLHLSFSRMPFVLDNFLHSLLHYSPCTGWQNKQILSFMFYWPLIRVIGEQSG